MSEETTPNPERILLPLDAYRLRCIKCEKKTSSKGNRMLAQTFEIFGHKILNINGSNVDVNGLQIDFWQVFTEKNIDIFNDQRKAFGLRPLKTAELDNVNADEYLGQEGAGMVRTESKEQILPNSPLLQI